MDSETELITFSSTYAVDVLARYPEKFYFHNLQHTKNVVTAARIIGEKSGLSFNELETVTIAAWFHDIGYLSAPTHHEEESCSMAREKLSIWNASEEKIMAVEETIMATKMPHRPKSLTGKVLCDADLSHLAAENFLNTSEMLRKEFSILQNKNFENDAAWWQFNLDFMEKHEYLTSYGKQTLKPLKEINIKNVKSKLSDL
jgi:predicted metal-dependent HD superfamily phosphohydrolase